MGEVEPNLQDTSQICFPRAPGPVPHAPGSRTPRTQISDPQPPHLTLDTLDPTPTPGPRPQAPGPTPHAPRPTPHAPSPESGSYCMNHVAQFPRSAGVTV